MVRAVRRKLSIHSSIVVTLLAFVLINHDFSSQLSGPIVAAVQLEEHQKSTSQSKLASNQLSQTHVIKQSQLLHEKHDAKDSKVLHDSDHGLKSAMNNLMGKQAINTLNAKTKQNSDSHLSAAAQNQLQNQKDSVKDVKTKLVGNNQLQDQKDSVKDVKTKLVGKNQLQDQKDSLKDAKTKLVGSNQLQSVPKAKPGKQIDITDRANVQYDKIYEDPPAKSYNPSAVAADKNGTIEEEQPERTEYEYPERTEYENPERTQHMHAPVPHCDKLMWLFAILLLIMLVYCFWYSNCKTNKVIAEYIWIDGAGGLRAKCRTLDRPPASVSDVPEWNYDGSSTYQATTENSEVILKPAFIFKDPFRGGNNIMVLCETYIWSDTTYQELVPTNTNFRHFAKKIFEANKNEEPWYGIEQEYTIVESDSKFETKPYGWPQHGYPSNQGPYYCSVGGKVCYGRTIADAHYKCCLKAGITISGTNSEVMPGQWEFQIGPCKGIEQGDHMFAARYLLQRVAEQEGLSISFKPKLFKDWNGSGCHTNYSTKTMRQGYKGMEYIHDMMQKFKAKHMVHMELYGQDNNKRLTGIHETSPYDKFSYGAGNRAASIRIPTGTMNQNGKGYIEDRRPASNIDPYVVTSIIFDTTVLIESQADQMIAHYRAWVKWLKTVTIEMS